MAKQEEPAKDIASRIIMLHGEVNEGNIRDVIKQMFEFDLKDNDKPINFFVNSYGGYVHEMFALYDVMRNVKSPIHSFCLGKTMSAGVLLFAAGKKGHRKIGKHATMMIHPCWAVHFGNIFDQDNELKEQKRLQEMLEDAYVDVSNLTKKQVREIMEERQEKFYSAEEAVKMGFADSVL